MNLLMDRIESSIGDLLVVSDGNNLCAIEFDGDEARLRAGMRKRFGEINLARASNPQGFSSSIRAYFAGNLRALNSIPVMTGGTEFQRLVWNALREIPCGSTSSYGQLAKKIGKPGSSRAVGLANGSNPIPIVVPCHRVIGANASLTGYGGGLDRKRWLLEHEGVILRVRKNFAVTRSGQAELSLQGQVTRIV